MSMQQMRWALKNKTKYRFSTKWHDRVDKMPDYQVAAVYNRLLSAGEILK